MTLQSLKGKVAGSDYIAYHHLVCFIFALPNRSLNIYLLTYTYDET